MGTGLLGGAARWLVATATWAAPRALEPHGARPRAPGTADPASAKPASLPSSAIAWYSFIGRMGALALRAAMPTNDDERAALVALLEALVTNGFPARRRGQVAADDHPSSGAGR